MASVDSDLNAFKDQSCCFFMHGLCSVQGKELHILPDNDSLFTYSTSQKFGHVIVMTRSSHTAHHHPHYWSNGFHTAWWCVFQKKKKKKNELIGDVLVLSVKVKQPTCAKPLRTPSRWVLVKLIERTTSTKTSAKLSSEQSVTTLKNLKCKRLFNTFCLLLNNVCVTSYFFSIELQKSMFLLLLYTQESFQPLLLWIMAHIIDLMWFLHNSSKYLGLRPVLQCTLLTS